MKKEQLKLDSHDETSLMLVPSNARIVRSTNIREKLECVESDVRSLMAALHSSTVHSGIIELVT